MKLFFNSQEAMSYELESPSGKDAQLAEKKFMLRIPLARKCAVGAHFLGERCYE